LRKGQKVEAVVLRLDPAQRRLSLGLKELRPDAWEDFISKAQIGGVVRGKVSRLAPFGAFVDLGEGIEGLCHASEIGDERSSVDHLKLEVGQELDFRIIRLNLTEKKIGLSLKNANQVTGAEAEQVGTVADKPAETFASGEPADVEASRPLSAAKVEPYLARHGEG